MSDRDVQIHVNAVSQITGGGATVAQRLAPHLARQRPSWRFFLFTTVPVRFDPPAPANLVPVVLPALRSVLPRLLWEQTVLPRMVRRQRSGALVQMGGFVAAASAVPQIAAWQNSFLCSRDPFRRALLEATYNRTGSLLHALSMRKAEMNVFPTRFSLEECVASGHALGARRTAIHFGVDLPPRDRSLEISRHTDRAIAVGDIYRHKNYETLFDALDLYRQHHREPLAIEIAGKTINGPYQQALLQSVAERGLTDSVKFLGALSSEQVRERYRRALFYVTTSRLESFGLPPLEAMAHGTPVIASRAGSLPEVVGDAAWLVDPLDAQEIANALYRLRMDGQLRATLREKGFERIRAFSWERCAAEYLSVIEAALR